MSDLIVNGTEKLSGEVWVSGAKNSVLPILAATFLCEGQSVLHNCPRLSDVSVSIKILEVLGCKCEFSNGTAVIDSSSVSCSVIPPLLMHQMRSSVVFMGAVAARCGRVSMSLPGGCELGPRPIDLHIDALKRLGADVYNLGGSIVCEMPNGAIGTDIHLKFPSVGATENIILAASTGKGITCIYNAAKEPEICDLCMFLNKAGANIKGFGTDIIEINGVKSLKATEYEIMPDRIVAATYMMATAACSGNVRLLGVDNSHLTQITSVLSDCGCNIKTKENELIIASKGRLKSFDTVSTQPFPGFPTDAGPLLVALGTVQQGTGVFIENIFDGRYRYIDELIRLGAKIKIIGRVAVITGVKSLMGAEVHATDLRGGAALVIAALSAVGRSKISNCEYIDRGYEDIEKQFNLLGANIKRV